MVPGQIVDVLVVVALVSFYGGLSRELATTADFVDVRLGLGLSLGAYVATGVAILLSLAAVVLTAIDSYQADDSLLAVAGVAVGVGVAFLVVYGLFFKLGTALYDLLLRVGLDLS